MKVRNFCIRKGFTSLNGTDSIQRKPLKKEKHDKTIQTNKNYSK